MKGMANQLDHRYAEVPFTPNYNIVYLISTRYYGDIFTGQFNNCAINPY